MEDDILITPTNESIEDVTKKEQIVEFQDMDNFINNSDATDETIVVKEKYVEEENTPTQVNIESVKKKNIDYYFIINIVIFLIICIVLLTGILNANNIRVRIAKKYCNYLKTSDLKKLENYVVKNTDYYIKELEDVDKNKITCMVIDTGEELNKEDINLLNRQNLFDKKITKAYKVLINYKLNSQEDNFENKKSLVIVKVDNSWKLLNPNNYN
jgi:hypothetical protein